MKNASKILKDDFFCSERSIEIVERAHASLNEVFKSLEERRQANQIKLLKAFQKADVSTRHFSGTTGYGYDDAGRDTLDRLFAEVFCAQKALVRPHIVSGTHAIGIVLYGLLRPGDNFVSVAGKPYDTLDQIINGKNGSLAEYGIGFESIGLAGGDIDREAVKKLFSSKKIKLAMIQRSKGYAWRKSIDLDEIAAVSALIKSVSPQTIVFVDNCYGEFVETDEPLEKGADIIAGSLIKNPGGGLAPTGAYIAGKSELIDQISYRLTAPGIGGEVGSYSAGYLPFYQGLFMAPHIVCEALKGAVLCAKVFETLGYEVLPKA
ncbi:MAG TPA: methionine gamma-lyase family protein, partial [Clostridia bacterium]|nr:methionine gamma-lyase family protein [Clostridia bacterium]